MKQKQAGMSGTIIAALIVCGLAVAGSVGPWVTVGFISVGGLNGDGWITLICGGFAGAAAFVQSREPDSKAWVLVILFAVGILVVAINDLVSISERGTGQEGWGLMLVLVAAAALLFLGPLLGAEQRDRRRAAARAADEGPVA